MIHVYVTAWQPSQLCSGCRHALRDHARFDHGAPFGLEYTHCTQPGCHCQQAQPPDIEGEL